MRNLLFCALCRRVWHRTVWWYKPVLLLWKSKVRLRRFRFRIPVTRFAWSDSHSRNYISGCGNRLTSVWGYSGLVRLFELKPVYRCERSSNIWVVLPTARFAPDCAETLLGLRNCCRHQWVYNPKWRHLPAVEQMFYRNRRVAVISFGQCGRANRNRVHCYRGFTVTAPATSVCAVASRMPKWSFSSICSMRDWTMRLRPSESMLLKRGTDRLIYTPVVFWVMSDWRLAAYHQHSMYHRIWKHIQSAIFLSICRLTCHSCILPLVS